MRPTDKTRNQDLARRQGDHSTLYVSLELSRSTWLVTSLSPNSDKMSEHSIAAGDAPKSLALLARLRGRAEQLVGGSHNVLVIQEAGLDGFWVHRSLEANDIESHVVDPASIAVSRRRRRAKTDTIDGETLLRTLLAWKRGAKWPHSAVDAAILIVVHLFASSCRPNASNGGDSRGSSFIPACRAGTDEQVRSRRQPEDRRTFGCQFHSSEGPGSVAE
jgi:hypothetical protein